MECGGLCAGLQHFNYGFKYFFLSGWLLCKVGCFVCVFMRYKTLRQFVNMCAGSFRYVVVRRRRVWCIAMSSARRIFWSPGSISAILRFLKGLYIP